MIKRNLNKKVILFPTIVSIVLSGMLIFDRTQNEAWAAASSELYFAPATQSVQPDADFTLDAMIDPKGVNQITAVEAHISYDNTKFRLDSIDTAGSPFTIVFENNASTGTIIVGVSTPQAPDYTPTAVSEVSKIATVHFHSLAAVTNSQITFTAESQAAALNEGSENVINLITPSLVTVNSRTYGISDFSNLVADWLKTITGSPADANSDGHVNSRDLGIMMSSWSN